MHTAAATTRQHAPVLRNTRIAAAAKSPAAGPPVSAQTANLTFTKSSAIGIDKVARVSDANLDAATNQLTLGLDLKAGQKYSFSFYFKSGGPTVSLIDDKGKKTAVNMASGFTVPKTGSYKLSFQAGYSLKNSANFDNLAITAKSVLPSTSGDSRIDALVSGGTNQWWHDDDAVATKGTEKITPTANGLDANSSAKNLTFSFLSSAPTGQSMTGFQPMTDAQKAAVRKAFDYYAKIINVSFTEVEGDGAGDINFGTNNQASSAGYANPPNASPTKDKDFLFLANNVASNSDPGMQEGGYGWTTVLHEIGHTLGLKHPGNYNAGGGSTPGPYLPAAEDDHQHTIMSYKDNNLTRGVNASTGMVYDVAALQYLYGANKNASTANADGTFVFTSDKNYLQTLWSAKGTDTIDLSQMTRSSNVDLNAGAYSSINIIAPTTGRTTYSGNKNIGIANGSKINQVTLSSTQGIAETVTLNRAYADGTFNTINAFDATDDKINLKTSFFGTLAAGNIEFGTTATKSATKIVVNPSTGEIFYDADGKGKGVAKKIAQYNAVTGRGEITAKNFAFIA